MKLGLSTVRAKLTALVAFSAIVTFTALPVLSWVMDRQLIAQVHERVPAAVQGFALELDGDLRDLDTIVEQLSSQPEVVAALRSRDARILVAQGKIFHDNYPQMDLAFFDVADKLVVQIEVGAPPPDARTVPELASLAPNALFKGIVAHGCESDADAPPAFVIAKRVEGAGIVVACLPLDIDYLKEVAEKLGVEVAFVGPGKAISFGHSPRYPTGSSSQAKAGSTLVKHGDREWALARVTPPSMAGREGQYVAVIAIDVTDIRKVVSNNLLWAMAILAMATLLSLALGVRIASVMSRSLSRVNAALLKLQKHEYAHVDMIHSGDEIEDLANGFNVMVDGLQERDKLRSTFGKYMTQTVMEHLMSGKVQLGGETLTVTILFSDIRGFTSLSEEMNDAQALVALLNEYFTEMVRIVMEENGVVDKYIGDAIMAVFGAPVSKNDDAVRAVRAAVRMRLALADLNERLVARGVSPLRTGIGIHTGEVVAGNIGSEQRMEYTVIGDAVNLASRLESSTKELNVDVLISSDTYALVKDTCVAEAVREVTVKGRSEAVMTYAVHGLNVPPAR
jgi:adenylate cyclase